MSSYDLSAINSFDNPENISLVIKDLELKSSTVEITLEVNSVNMIKLKL
jgi:alpha-L-arabinofuranosidase